MRLFSEIRGPRLQYVVLSHVVVWYSVWFLEPKQSPQRQGTEPYEFPTIGGPNTDPNK